MTRLLGVPDAEARRLQARILAGESPPLPGAVRASFGLGTTQDDIDRLVAALQAIAEHGPSARYEHVPELDEFDAVHGSGRQGAPFPLAVAMAQ